LVLQAGVEYRLSRKWELFADYKHIWLNVHAEGFLAGEPVRARVALNPDLISTGIKFHFG
jgi:outer membrane protein